jgi:hypothetical protein
MLPATTTPRTASKASWIRRTWFTRQLCPGSAAKAVALDRLCLTKATALRPSWARENRAEQDQNYKPLHGFWKPEPGRAQHIDLIWAQPPAQLRAGTAAPNDASLCQVVRATFLLSCEVALVCARGFGRRVRSGPGVAWPKSRPSGCEPAALSPAAAHQRGAGRPRARQPAPREPGPRRRAARPQPGPERPDLRIFPC